MCSAHLASGRSHPADRLHSGGAKLRDSIGRMLDFAREIAMLYVGARLTGGITAPARQEGAAARGCAAMLIVVTACGACLQFFHAFDDERRGFAVRGVDPRSIGVRESVFRAGERDQAMRHVELLELFGHAG